jgi:hypothetical protein
MKMGLGLEARELDNQAIGQLTMIAFYNFLHVDQYTTKGQTDQEIQNGGHHILQN